jgi:anti-sigma regulatory factor (Ser/Thr protein kinase)
MDPLIHVSNQAPAIARQIVRETLASTTDRDRLADLQLIVSELAQNVVRHSSLSAEDTFSLAIDTSEYRVRVTVNDAGTGFSRGELLPASEDPWSGRGLALVDGVASRWGAERSEGGGTTAWAEIDLR